MESEIIAQQLHEENLSIQKEISVLTRKLEISQKENEELK